MLDTLSNGSNGMSSSNPRVPVFTTEIMRNLKSKYARVKTNGNQKIKIDTQ